MKYGVYFKQKTFILGKLGITVVVMDGTLGTVFHFLKTSGYRF